MLAPTAAQSTHKALIEHHFDDRDLQAEFNALSSNEDRLDYIEAVKALDNIRRHGTVSFEEMKAQLSVE